MTLAEASRLVETCSEQMSARYGKVVFDEWTLIALDDGKGRILEYIGPRKADFQKNFAADVEGLSAELSNQQLGPGDFDFARHAGGTRFDAFMVLGRGIYLICNNTVESMSSITKDSRWLGAQVPFVELSDKVRANPVVLPAWAG
jgi:hypothetical protein